MLLLPLFCCLFCFFLHGVVLVTLATASEAEAAEETSLASAKTESLNLSAADKSATTIAPPNHYHNHHHHHHNQQQQHQLTIPPLPDSPLSVLAPRSSEADETDGLLSPLEGFFMDEMPPINHHPSHKGSGEKYGRLLSKGKDLQGLPETHPARVHADSRFARRKSFQLILAGLVLAAAYLLSYYYHTWGSGVGTHAERHTFALNRISSPTSALLLVMAWRLWLGLIVSGLLTLALDVYRLESAIARRRRVLSKKFLDHWELLVGPPLLLLLFLSGRATRQFPLETSSAIAGAKGILGETLSRSGPAFESFLLDAVSQIPFGLAVVGLMELMFSLVGAVVHARSKKKPLPIRKLAMRPPPNLDSEEGSTTRAGSVGPMPLESDQAQSERTDTRAAHSRRKNRRERSRRRRSQPTVSWRLPSEEGGRGSSRDRDRDDSSQTASKSRRSYTRRGRMSTARYHSTSSRTTRPQRRPMTKQPSLTTTTTAPPDADPAVSAPPAPPAAAGGATAEELAEGGEE
ncbi:hypothetical protein ACSSS7_000749 [Eimeria intestinalis]